VPAGQLGISTYIVPPLAVVAGWLVFSEVPTLLTIIGGVVCLGGVALSRRRPKPRQVPDVVVAGRDTVIATTGVPQRSENLPE
jgi:hypothetical protein